MSSPSKPLAGVGARCNVQSDLASDVDQSGELVSRNQHDDSETELGAGLSGTTPASVSTMSAGEREAAIKRLARLPDLEYEVVREQEASRLGVRPSALDAAVRRARKKERAEAEIFEKVQPWPQPTDLRALLDEIETLVSTHVICPRETATACALWVAFTWFIDHVQVAPIALITAPEKRCGKSTLLDVFGRLVRRPLSASNISAAAVFRIIEMHTPTLLLDEADTYIHSSEQLADVINSGHTRSHAYVIRLVGDDHDVRRFGTWGAKAIAGIGKPRPTIVDRSIALELRRKLPNERVELLRHTRPSRFLTIKRKLARAEVDFGPPMRDAKPAFPATLNDRQRDNWEPLLAVADCAGGRWPQRARQAAVSISSTSGSTEEEPAIELLADIRTVWLETPDNKLETKRLIEALCGDVERRWSQYDGGRPISPRQVAVLLRPFGIKSKNIARPW